MRIPGAQVQDVVELEKILKRPITLLDITHGTIFNSKKYRSGKYEEIEIVVHNSYAFPRNQHFSRDRIVKYFKNDTWKAINNALQGPQAIWLIGVGKACKQLVNDAIDWQYQEEIISEEKKSILSESLKVVDLTEQHPISGKINDDIRQACIEHKHSGCWNISNYHINDVVYINMKECYPASMQGQGEYAPWFNRFGHPIEHLVQVAVNGKLPQNDITGFAQVSSFKFASNIHPVIPVWYEKHFACRKDLTIGKAIISLTQQTKVWLPKNQNISCAIIDEGELNFLIKDCTDAGTFAGRKRCPLGFILTYFEDH
ncbi:20536_t:CDS:2 [Gigaspora margarita]|uniref:20536_t:CDS:1 n=1 Tax=Gigaspora margarita TaxID=4874 RepID=A0ABN7V039_GIGMA|nr:20536_t:CDS:2 [Gigaspora margarita]